MKSLFIITISFFGFMLAHAQGIAPESLNRTCKNYPTWLVSGKVKHPCDNPTELC